MDTSPLDSSPVASTPVPSIKERRIAGLLSFLLPGLGQVYQRHYRRGGGLFLAFSILAMIPEARWLLPLAALLAGAESYRGRQRPYFDPIEMPEWVRRLLSPRSESPYRPWLYGIVGSLGFCLWFGLFAPVLYPFRAQAQLNDQVDFLADRVRAFRAEKGKYPGTLREALKEGDGAVTYTDPWGTEYLYLTTEDAFQILSAGPDHKANTSDDYVFKLR